MSKGSVRPIYPVKIVDKAELLYIIDHRKQQKGLYLSLLEDCEDGAYLAALDNSTEYAWYQEFDSVRDAVEWLRRENDVSI